MSMYNDEMHKLYLTAHGLIPYNLMNDYMFRVVLQENKFVLRGFIGSLLHLDQGDIRSVEIKNPIKLGEQIDDKTLGYMGTFLLPRSSSIVMRSAHCH